MIHRTLTRAKRNLPALALALASLSIGASTQAGPLIKGKIIDLGVSNRVGAVNASGKVAGGAQIGGNPAAPYHAFLAEGSVLTDLGTLGGGYSSAAAVNSKDEVVGESNIVGDADKHAFLYSGGSMRDLGTLGGGYSTATGVNSSGVVVGQSSLTGNTTTHAFRWSDGVMQDLGTLGGEISSAAGINDAGQIVGQSTINGNIVTRAFRYSDGAMTDLGTLGGTNSFGYGINAKGDVVGQAYTTGDAAAKAFLWSGGAMVDLGTLEGFRGSVAKAINSDGLIVGNSFGKIDPKTNLFVQHAFLYDKGVLTNLNDLLPENSGWTLLEANGINDAGQISGIGTLFGVRHGFLFSLPPAPAQVPEPSTLAIFGLAILGGVARRRIGKRRPV